MICNAMHRDFNVELFDANVCVPRNRALGIVGFKFVGVSMDRTYLCGFMYACSCHLISISVATIIQILFCMI